MSLPARMVTRRNAPKLRAFSDPMCTQEQAQCVLFLPMDPSVGASLSTKIDSLIWVSLDANVCFWMPSEFSGLLDG